jgi:hypothetical protein
MDMCEREMIDMYLDDIVSSSGLIRPAYIVGMVCKHPRTRLEVLVQRGLIHLRWSVDDGTRVLSNAVGVPPSDEGLQLFRGVVVGMSRSSRTFLCAVMFYSGEGGSRDRSRVCVSLWVKATSGFAR